MNYFLDTEFSHLPWEDGARIISIGIVNEEGKSYYACLNDFNENDLSDFVKKKVLPSLPTQNKRKSPSQIKQELLNFFNGNPTSQIWSIFPTKKQLESFGITKSDSDLILKKYGDFDFQLLSNILKNSHPQNWPKHGSNLTPLLEKLNRDEIPSNPSEHNALSDALWNKQVWELVHGKKIKESLS